MEKDKWAEFSPDHYYFRIYSINEQAIKNLLVWRSRHEKDCKHLARLRKKDKDAKYYPSFKVTFDPGGCVGVLATAECVWCAEKLDITDYSIW